MGSQIYIQKKVCEKPFCYLNDLWRVTIGVMTQPMGKEHVELSVGLYNSETVEITSEPTLNA